MLSHFWDEIGNAGPVARYSKDPLEYGMRGIELFIKSSLVELLGDGLTRHQSALTDEQSSFRVECGDSQNDLCCSILLQSSLTLLDEAEQKAHDTRAQALVLISGA
jgi:hypothetical protein